MRYRCSSSKVFTDTFVWRSSSEKMDFFFSALLNCNNTSHQRVMRRQMPIDSINLCCLLPPPSTPHMPASCPSPNQLASRPSDQLAPERIPSVPSCSCSRHIAPLSSSCITSRCTSCAAFAARLFALQTSQERAPTANPNRDTPSDIGSCDTDTPAVHPPILQFRKLRK
jgi:hypothetical protein